MFLRFSIGALCRCENSSCYQSDNFAAVTVADSLLRVYLECLISISSAMANEAESNASGATNTGIVGVGDQSSDVAGGPSLVMDLYCMNMGENCTGKSIYVTWKKFMEIALSSKSQLGFVRGGYPRAGDPIMLSR